ncbi:glutamate synthase [Pseudoscardovia radai]|uniref:ferredoxin--NADP(+) reductase n=1 Tax=Pseudoscardovia radai TaxID=987066 RepID=A0A261EWJ0_9BIFI|nr:FAD-dependent oxidoreductase [Pseudoscardovia radai]OZG51221.1 glutamate synthase [Pseudoscardovia radai]
MTDNTQNTADTAAVDTANREGAEARPLRVAVVGAGPAGVYTSDILLRQLAQRGEALGLGIDATIDLYEKLPVPFGLVRYGVAPDHPSIKFIQGALARTLDNPKIRLFCDVEVGKDVSLDELRERYDAVVFATGAVDDRPLRIPGHDLKHVYGAAHFVEWYDGYPTGPRTWPLTDETVAVIGGGNVAMDVARELVRNADDLLGTDIPQNVYDGIKANACRELHLFVRRDVAHAKFSVQELRELEKLPGVQLVVNEDDFDLSDATLEVAADDKLTRQMVEELFVIRDMAEDMEYDGGTDFNGQPATKKYVLHFNSNPVEVLGDADGAVRGIRVERTETSPEGSMTGTGETYDVPVQAVYHAIGYRPAAVNGVAYDEKGTRLLNESGRIEAEPETDGAPLVTVPYVYATGWAKRGPVGLIGSTKSDALETVNNILDDWAASGKNGRVAPKAGDEAETIAYLQGKGLQPIGREGWDRVVAYEHAQGEKVGRDHIKLVEPDQIRRVARGEETA